MPEHILEADSIMYTIGDRLLLSDVYLKCCTGEVIGLLGRNGSGKTTLLQILFGTKHTDHKFIRIDGQVYSKPYRHRHLIGYLPQDGFLPHTLSLQEITRLFLASKPKQDRVLTHERVNAHQHKTAQELSTGERRFFELLLLLQLDVKFLLLDEPFSGLEPLYTEKIQELIVAYKNEKGFIMTDHDYRSVLGISTQLLLLTDGACRHLAHPEELEQWGYVPAGSFT